MEYYEVEVDCMQYCYGGSAKFTVDPNGYGEWAKRADVELLIAERDRLAAENAELRADLVVVGGAFSHAHATLDVLREALLEVLPPHMSWRDALDGARAILYPKETDNG